MTYGKRQIARGALTVTRTERFTEIETTQGVLVVDCEVSSIAKGVPVYRNGWDKVRVGGLGSRTFDRRRV